MIRRHPVLSVALVTYLVFVAWVTLNPSPPDPHDVGLFDLLLVEFAKYDVTSWLTYDMVEFLANVGMFVPIGVLAVLISGRWWHGIVVGAVLTCAIEFTQRFLPERNSDIRDLAANTLGAIIGSGIAYLVVKRTISRRERN